MEHSDQSIQLPDELHVVLDHDDAGVPIDLPDQGGGPRHLVARHAGGWLVEQDELRPPRHDHADLHPLALAMGKRSDRLAGEAADSEPFDQVGRGPTGVPCRVARARGDPEVLTHREAFEHARHLILDPDAAPGDLVHSDAFDPDPLESDRPGARSQLAAQQLEEGALAGAVRADQAAELTPPQVEVHAVDRAHAAKALL